MSYLVQDEQVCCRLDGWTGRAAGLRGALVGLLVLLHHDAAETAAEGQRGVT